MEKMIDVAKEFISSVDTEDTFDKSTLVPIMAEQEGGVVLAVCYKSRSLDMRLKIYSVDAEGAFDLHGQLEQVLWDLPDNHHSYEKLKAALDSLL